MELNGDIRHEGVGVVRPAGLTDVFAEDSIIVDAAPELLGEIHGALQRFSATTGGLSVRSW